MSDGAGARATVVVASDDEVVGEVLARIVEAGGHEAVRTTDPSGLADAVASATADAVVVDLGAATADAVRALRDGADRGGAVRAVAICTGPASALLAWQAGADGVLTRPFPADELRTELRGALDADDAARQARRAEQARVLSA